MKTLSIATSALLLTLLTFATPSCDRKEKVLDVDTPSGGIEIERDKKSGEIEMKVEDKK
jgi:hypothetical protein